MWRCVPFVVCRIEPDDATAGSKPNSSIGALYGGVQGTHLKRKSRESLPRTKMVTFDLIRRTLQGLRDFGAADVKDATQAMEPKVAVGRFHDSRDSTKQLIIRRLDIMEAPVVELL